MNDVQIESKLVSGVLFEQSLGFLSQKKGKEGIEALEQSLGPQMYDQYRQYPVEKFLELQRAIIILVYGQETASAYHDLGIHTFNAYTQTLVGATLTSISKSPVEVLQKIQELWNSAVNFGTRTLIEADTQKGRAVIKIVDDPRNPSYIQGVIDAGMQETEAISPSSKILDLTDNSFKIEVTWRV